MKLQNKNRHMTSPYKIIYEPEDCVRLNQVPGESTILKVNDQGTVIETEFMWAVIETELMWSALSIRVRFQSYIQRGLGIALIPIDCIEPAGHTAEQLPGLIQKWKQDKVRRLIGA